MNEFSEYLNNLLERNIKTVPGEDEYVDQTGCFTASTATRRRSA